MMTERMTYTNTIFMQTLGKRFFHKVTFLSQGQVPKESLTKTSSTSLAGTKRRVETTTMTCFTTT